MATQYTAGLSAGQVLTAATMNSIGAVSETYTPTWRSSGTQPAIGNGTLTGRYFRIQKLVFVQILMITGSTTTYGTGQYSWDLPLTARTGLYGFMSNGICRIWDASLSATYHGQTLFFGGATTNIACQINTGANVGQTAPMTWATSDEAVIALWYEAA